MMEFRKWLKAQFTLRTVNKKVFLISKLIAVSVILIFFLSKSKLVENNFIFFLILLVVVFLIFLLEFYLYKIIVNPICYLERIGEKFSNLDFSEYSTLQSGDEFERLEKI